MEYNYRIESIKLLENLGVLPQLNVCEQLNSCSLVVASLLSEKWEDFVRMRGIRMESDWKIKILKDILMIHLEFKNEEQNFQIGFKEDPNSTTDFYFEQDERENSITFFHKTAHQLELCSFHALQILSHLFPPIRYNFITVLLGPRSPDFPFRFLLRLPRAATKEVDLNADEEIDCGDLVKFLQVVAITDLNDEIRNSKWAMSVRIKNLAPCDEVTIRNKYVRIDDARFFTRESIQKLDFYQAEIGENNFTSKDFNAFFRKWMMKQEEKLYRSRKISFNIREDQKIKMEEVMEGLNPHIGKPRLRDRWRLGSKNGTTCGWQYVEATDCDNGWDIINSDDRLGTVLLEPNRLSFFIYSPTRRFTQVNRVNKLEWCIQCDREFINLSKNRQEELERMVAAQGVNPISAHLDELVWLSVGIKNTQERLEDSLLGLEKLKMWNND